MSLRASTHFGLIGCGDFGRQLELLVRALHPDARFVYFDDEPADNRPVVPFEAHREPRFRELSFVVGLGYARLEQRRSVVETLLELDRRLPVLRHPSAFVHPSAQLGAGAIVYPLCNVDKACRIGAGVVLNNSVVVSHDAEIGQCAYLSPGVVLSGHVTIGACAFVGSAAAVANGVAIGDGSRIGIGTVVTRSVEAGASVIGNPMRTLSRPLSLTRRPRSSPRRS